MHRIDTPGMELRHIDLNLLRVFDAVVSERSVSRAAVQLSLTQPAVSHALARLRIACGDAILERHGRAMVPTAHAAALLPQVRALLAQAQRIFSSTAHFDAAQSQRSFQVGASDYAVQRLLPPVLASVRRTAPGVRLRVLHAGRSDALDLLHAGAIDLALGVFNSADDSLQLRTVLEEPYACAMAAGHPLARGTLTLPRYLQAAHLQVLVQPGRLGAIEQTLARLGVERRVAMTSAHFGPAVALVAATDLLLTAPRGLFGPRPSANGLHMAPPPFALEPYRHQIAASKRAMADPGIAWLYALIESGCDTCSRSARPAGRFGRGRSAASATR